MKSEKKKFKSAHEETRALPLVSGVGPLKLKPTTDKRIGHLYEAIIKTEIVTSKFGVRRR